MTNPGSQLNSDGLGLDEEAFRSRDRSRFKESKNRFGKAVREAKRLYSKKLRQQFSGNDYFCLKRV